MEHLRDESTYLEADLENPDKRVIEIIKEFADEYTPEVLTEKKKNIYVILFRQAANSTAYQKSTKAKKLKELWKKDQQNILKCQNHRVYPEDQLSAVQTARHIN